MNEQLDHLDSGDVPLDPCPGCLPAWKLALLRLKLREPLRGSPTGTNDE